MGNTTFRSTARSFRSWCPARPSEEELRAKIIKQIEDDRKAKETAEKEAQRKRKQDAHDKQEHDKKQAEEKAAEARRNAEEKLKRDNEIKALIQDVLKPHAATVDECTTDLLRVETLLKSMGTDIREEVLDYTGQKERELKEGMMSDLSTLETKLVRLELQAQDIDDAVAVIGGLIGDHEKIKNSFEQTVAGMLLGIDLVLKSTRADVAENLKNATEHAAELRMDISVVRELMKHHEEAVKNMQIEFEEQKSELKQDLETERATATEDREELRKTLNAMVSAVREMEDRIYFLENQDDDICSECGSEATAQLGGTKKKHTLTPVKEDTAAQRDSAAEQTQPKGSSLVERIARGEFIPRRNHDDRVDMIDWPQLKLVQPRISESSKTTKWDDLFIATLTKPPLRQDFAWRTWKESIWHWAVSLRLVGASFTKMGQQIIAQSFRRNALTGEIFEGEHSVATAAGQSRDLVEIMVALDQHFCPHTRSVQSALESGAHLIRRPDGQSPMLFLHLLGIVYRREVEINGDANVRTEKAKVDRAIKALLMQKPTEQLIRSSVARAPADKPYTYHNLTAEVDSLNITDHKRYKQNGAGVDVHFPKERDEIDYMQKLLEQIGERLSIDSLGQHAMTNSHFHQTARQQTFRGQHGTGLLTDGGIFLQPAPPGGVPLTGPSLQQMASLANQGGNISGGPAVLTTTGQGQLQNNTATSEGKTEKDAAGKEFWVPAKLTQEEQAKRIESSNRFKLKKEPGANWCKWGEWCNDVLTTGTCKGKHTKKEFWRMITQFERNFPDKAKKLQKERAEKKAAEAAKKTT
eukprot:g18094.t1